MKSFLLALQFLTIIPVSFRHISEKAVTGSIVCFPLVGLLLGFILTGADRFLYFLGLEQIFINVILIVLLIILTGGLHLDGLADTIDAFSSRKNKEEMLRVMRDSRIGAMGVLGIVSVVLLKIAFLSSVDVSFKATALLLACVLSRWSLVLTMFLFPYARQEGKAKDFIRATNLKVFIFSTIVTLFCVVAFSKGQGLLLMAVIALSSYIIGRSMTNKISGITGDTLGATNELIETIVLLSICVLGRTSLWI